MKKKKKKKVVRKKAVRRKTKRRRETIRDKIKRIKDSIPYIDPCGKVEDPETGEVLFKYTEAQEVFRIYRQACDLEGLIYRPYADEHIKPIVVEVNRMPCLIGFFCIQDVKTGEKVIGWGCGMGRNGDWSGNTAATRALKQFLLTTFEAGWEDPEHLTADQQKEMLRLEVIKELEDSGTLAEIEQIKYWTEKLNQPSILDKKDGKKKRNKPK